MEHSATNVTSQDLSRDGWNGMVVGERRRWTSGGPHRNLGRHRTVDLAAVHGGANHAEHR